MYLFNSMKTILFTTVEMGNFRFRLTDCIGKDNVRLKWTSQPKTQLFIHNFMVRLVDGFSGRNYLCCCSECVFHSHRFMSGTANVDSGRCTISLSILSPRGVQIQSSTAAAEPGFLSHQVGTAFTWDPTEEAFPAW